jgi:CPA2 family monovalent cation:H+ antiporter-2
MFVVTHPHMVAAGLAIVLLFKPLAALIIVALCGYPIRTGLTVAIGLAQIGEFSFILAQVATDNGLLPPEGMNVLVATAMISITINPLIFRSLDRIEAAVERVGWLRRALDLRHSHRVAALNSAMEARSAGDARPTAVIVGYGPVGRLVDAMLRDAGMRTVVIDMNIDTVQAITRSGHAAVYGDATRREVLDQAGLRTAAHLVVTLPHTEGRAALVLAARELNPTVEISVRARYLAERETLDKAGASTVVFEEGEAGVALARRVLEKRGVEPAAIEKLLGAVRQLWKMQG